MVLAWAFVGVDVRLKWNEVVMRSRVRECVFGL